MVHTTLETILAEHPPTREYNGIGYRPICITAGFPCQDVSHAGRGAGLAGERSGLWRETCGAIRLVRPLYALLENVAALLGRGMGDVQGDLAESGYDTEWDCIPASAVGAPHQRDRVWILAYPQCSGLSGHIFQKLGWLCCVKGKTYAKFGNRNVPCGISWEGDGEHLSLDDGISRQMASCAVKGYGNAIVPQIPEIIFREIVSLTIDTW